jgi:microsomal dipeptidase-like Zn-dependent dipeptidase
MKLNIFAQKLSLYSLIVFLCATLGVQAQNQENFYVTSFPYVDVHLHSALKPFNSRHVNDYNIWEQIDHNCKGKMANLFVNGSKEVPRTSQCHFEGLLEGNVKLGYLSLTPLEKGMMDARLLNEKKKGIATMSCVSGVENDSITEKEQVLNYYEDLVQNIEFVQEGENVPYYKGGKAYTYEVARDGQHLRELMADPSKIAVVINIEGGHSLGHSLENEDVSHTLSYEQFYMANLDRIKGIKPLRDCAPDMMEYPVLSMNLNHFFWNGLSGHARTFSGLQTFVFGGTKGVGEPLTPLGEKVIKRMLDRSEGRRILVDVKHMSLEARKWYYNYLEELRAEGDTVGIISSHSTVAGISMHDEAYQAKDKKGKNKNSYLNLWNISLCDEDVRQIHLSKGIVGIMLDKYRLVGEEGKKLLKDAIPGSAQSRKLYAKILWANIFECIEAINDKSAWDIIAIGSDFDGMIVPFESYPRSNEMPELAQDLFEFLENPDDIFDLFTKEEVEKLMFGYSPEEILKKVMYENGYEFAIRNLNANTIPQAVADGE